MSISDIICLILKNRALNWKSGSLDDCWFNNIAICVYLESRNASLFVYVISECVSCLRSCGIMSCLNLLTVNTYFFFQSCWTLQIIHCLMIKLIPRIIPDKLVVAQLLNKFLPCSGSFVIAVAIKSITRLRRCTSIIFLLFLTARWWFFYMSAGICSLINFSLMYENVVIDHTLLNFISLTQRDFTI